MRHDVRICCKCTEESMMVRIWNMFVYQIHSKRNFFTIFIEFHVVKFKIEDIPCSTIHWLMTNSVFCLSIRYPRWPSIGLKSFLTSQCQKLISNFFEVFLKGLEPRKIIGIPKSLKPYHQGWALNPGIISGHPFCKWDLGAIWVLLILARSQGLRWSKLPF